MPLGTNHITHLTGGTENLVATFVPELWADDVLASFEANLVLRNYVVNFPLMKEKGDTVHIPVPSRGTASAKAQSTEVVLISNTDAERTYNITEHWHYAKLIEDIAKVQMLESYRRFYTDDAGYSLAKRVDTFLHIRAARLSSTGTPAGSDYGGAFVPDATSGLVAWDPAANANAGNAAALSDLAIRVAIQRLDDNDVPGRDRVFVIPPIEKRRLLGLSRFTEQAFTGEVSGENSIRNGMVGDLYGNPVAMSTNVERVDDGAASDDQFAVLYVQKDALVFISKQEIRTQSAYLLEWLGTLFVADNIYGGGILRDEAGLVIVVPDA